MKKIFSIVILLFFCWQFVGSYLYFESARHNIREKAKQMMKSSITNFQTLQLSRKEFKQIVWIKKHEFQYKSHLYDVRSIRQSKGKVNILCIQDNDEERLISQYSKQIQNHQKDSKKNTGSSVWHKLLSSVYLPIYTESNPFLILKEPHSKINIAYIKPFSLPHLFCVFNPPIYS